MEQNICKLLLMQCKKSKELIVDYQRFYGRRETFNIQPYAMKVYHQRWYVVGYIKELGGIRNIALDRTLEMNLSYHLLYHRILMQRSIMQTLLEYM